MKAHFTKLFDYDFTTNAIMIKAIQDIGSPGPAVKIMAHLLSVQQIWLQRVTQNPAANTGDLWPGWQTESFGEINKCNQNQWQGFLDNENDFERKITYKNFKGETFTNTLTDVLTHLINHGTHHRAQVGQQLKFAGAGALPVTDYIYYLRDHDV